MEREPQTVTLRLTDKSSIELPIVYEFKPGLVLIGTDDLGYEIAHTGSGLGILNGSAEFKARLMDYGRAITTLSVDWTAQQLAISGADMDALRVIRSMYWEGFEAPQIKNINEG